MGMYLQVALYHNGEKVLSPCMTAWVQTPSVTIKFVLLLIICRYFEKNWCMMTVSEITSTTSLHQHGTIALKVTRLSLQ